MKSLKSLALTSVCGLGLAAASTPAIADPLSTPSMSASLSANTSPFSVDLPDWFGDAGGKIYVGGAATGLAYVQSNATHAAPGDADTYLDLSNGQVWVEKTDGWLQFYVQAGVYSFPTLGVPYTKASTNVPATFGYAPVAYAKIQGAGEFSAFSIEGGKLPTLIGAEYGFTFQNLNIERGLLWNTEPIVSRGVQVNYAQGPITVSVSMNDGYYTNVLDDLSALASYALNGGADTFTFDGEWYLGSTNNPKFSPQGFTSSLFNNGQIYNFSYTHTQGPWTFTPYVQYQSIPNFGFAPRGTNIWAGALLVNYALDDNWKIGLRGEYESSTGTPATTFNTLGYGAGSNAWSLTLTPTYQYKIFFARVDASYVGLGSMVSGDGFGKAGTSGSQFRGVLEAGVLF